MAQAKPAPPAPAPKPAPPKSATEQFALYCRLNPWARECRIYDI
jgi:CP12 domain